MRHQNVVGHQRGHSPILDNAVRRSAFAYAAAWTSTLATSDTTFVFEASPAAHRVTRPLVTRTHRNRHPIPPGRPRRIASLPTEPTGAALPQQRGWHV